MSEMSTTYILATCRSADELLSAIVDNGWEVRIPTNIDRGGCAVVISKPGWGIVATGHGLSLNAALRNALEKP